MKIMKTEFIMSNIDADGHDESDCDGDSVDEGGGDEVDDRSRRRRVLPRRPPMTNTGRALGGCSI